MREGRPITVLLLLLLTLPCFTGCQEKPPAPVPAPTPTPERYAAAKTLFDRSIKEFHNPSAEKMGPERERLLAQAAAGYEQLLKDYPEQTNWCAQALRSLGAVRAAQGRTNDAVKLFAEVGRQYAGQDWEVIQAWKAAGDLLQEAGRPAEARPYYQQIIQRFDHTNTSQVIQIIVRAAKKQAQ